MRKRKKKPCPFCGKPIQKRSKACSACTTRVQWKDPKQRKKKIKAIKRACPSKPRPFCVDCGIQLRTLSAKRCVPCSGKFTAHLKGRPGRKVTKETREKLSQRLLKKYQEPGWKEKWMRSIKKRSNSKTWRKKQIEGSKRRSQKSSWRTNNKAARIRLANDPAWREIMKDNPCWQRGEKHPAWKGGRKSPVQLARHRNEYREWRKKVFERDDYTCQKCKVRGGKLHAHHLELFSENIEKRFDIDNGMTVCVPCHRKIHDRYIPE